MGCICVWSFAWLARLEEGGRGGGLIASFLPSLGSAVLHSLSPLSPSPSPFLCSFALFLPFPLPLTPSLSIAHLLGFLALCLCLRVSPSLPELHPPPPCFSEGEATAGRIEVGQIQ